MDHFLTPHGYPNSFDWRRKQSPIRLLHFTQFVRSPKKQLQENPPEKTRWIIDYPYCMQRQWNGSAIPMVRVLRQQRFWLLDLRFEMN
jgi:hypothetical protein